MAYSNEQIERNQLHKQLVIVENKPCSNTDCHTPYDRREIHRLIPGHRGGLYTLDNVVVLCFTCHRQEHPYSKFNVGDKVSLDGRTPNYIDLPRHSPRTVIAIRYDKSMQCNFYLLGSNSAGANTGNGNPLNGYSDYWFRSYQMKHYEPRRYHFKRPYTRHNLNTISRDENLTGEGISPCGLPFGTGKGQAESKLRSSHNELKGGQGYATEDIEN